jgi:hypothetical protein
MGDVVAKATATASTSDFAKARAINHKHIEILACGQNSLVCSANVRPLFSPYHLYGQRETAVFSTASSSWQICFRVCKEKLTELSQTHEDEERLVVVDGKRQETKRPRNCRQIQDTSLPSIPHPPPKKENSNFTCHSFNSVHSSRFHVLFRHDKRQIFACACESCLLPT